MQAEGADAHGGKQVAVERLQRLSRPARADRILADRLGRSGQMPFPAEQVEQPRRDHEQGGKDNAHVEEGVGAVAAQRVDQPQRQEARQDCRCLTEQDARPGELRLGAIVGRHFRGERLERNDLHRIGQLEQHIADQIIPEALTRQPHQCKAWQQRDRGQDEEATAAELAAQPGAAEMVGNIADHRRGEGVQDTRDGKDGRRLPGAKATELRVEDQHPAGNDRHRSRAQHVVGAIGEVILQADGTRGGWGSLGQFRSSA